MLDVWKKHELGEKANGPIWALASDGDSTYCLAKHLICVAKELNASEPLGNLLSDLLGFNCWTSKDGVISTCDPKHIFKRFATLLCNVSGFMVNDINIRPTDIVEQLALLPDMTFEKACQLLDPSDKQNVPKAVTLLQSLLQIKHLPLSPNPTINQH